MAYDRRRILKKGKILRLKFGFNPNSSSLGSDVSLLLMGAAALTLLVNLFDAGLRIWIRHRRDKTGAP